MTYVAYHSSPTASMATDGTRGGIAFLAGWTAMMTAMMVPATLPLILLYRTIARRQFSPARSRAGTMLLLTGYLAVWAATGVPVYAYSLLAQAAGSPGTVLPAALLVIGGTYQFTPLKRRCHARCSSPLSFLLQNWRQGAAGALRLGLVHGLDCLGCCAGLMASLVAQCWVYPCWAGTHPGWGECSQAPGKEVAITEHPNFRRQLLYQRETTVRFAVAHRDGRDAS